MPWLPAGAEWPGAALRSASSAATLARFPAGDAASWGTDGGDLRAVRPDGGGKSAPALGEMCDAGDGGDNAQATAIPGDMLLFSS